MLTRIVAFIVLLASPHLVVARPSDAQWSRLLIGRWHEFRHDTKFYADGTYTVDPDEQTGPTGTWRIENGILIRHFGQQGQPADSTTNDEIVELTRRLLKIRILSVEGPGPKVDGLPSKIFVLKRVSESSRSPR